MVFNLQFSISGVLGELLNTFVSGIPAFLKASTLLIIGFIIAKMTAKVIEKALSRLNVNKLGDKLNEIEMVEKTHLEIKLSVIFSKLIYYILLLFFFAAATDVLQMPALSKMVSDVITFVPNLIVAISWMVLGVLFAEALRSIVHTACKSIGIPSGKLISSLLFYFILINVVISALAQAKINTGFLEQNISLVIGGAVLAFSIGYGFASRDIVSNYLASFYSKSKFKVGDQITINGVTGEIIELDNSTVTLKTEKSKIIFPLSTLSREMVEIHYKCGQPGSTERGAEGHGSSRSP